MIRPFDVPVKEAGIASTLFLRLMTFLAFALLGACAASPADTTGTTQALCAEALDLSVEALEGHVSAFVWLDPVSGQSVCYGNADIRRIPASTFKIPHTLIALDSGVVDGPDSSLKWNPEKYPREEWWPAEWARDHTLASALEHSVVWYYREIAEMMGPDREQAYLESLDLGNAEVGDNPTSFWLVGPLEISAEEQVIFLQRLWAGTLPVSDQAQHATRDLVSVLSEANNERILGKTGTGRTPEGMLNWLVGVVERPEGPAFYAFWIEAEGRIPPERRVQVLADVRAQLAGGPLGLVR